MFRCHYSGKGHLVLSTCAFALGFYYTSGKKEEKDRIRNASLKAGQCTKYGGPNSDLSHAHFQVCRERMRKEQEEARARISVGPR